MKEASYYEKLGAGRVHCYLCPHNCHIADERTGICQVRMNRGGALYSEIYGKITSIAMDPIEKKPLYHFHPGSSILSIGTRGCNFSCSFCQNWNISQAMPELTPMGSEEVIRTAKNEGSIGIAYTYNEPLIWLEYVLDTAKLAREAGFVNVLVTNGFASPEPFADLLPWIDAINLDIKSIKPDFYKTLCRGTLEPVLANAKAAAKRTHLEITNLIITGYNDTDAEFEELATWTAAELGPDTPTHLSAYFPRYRLRAPATPVETLERAHGIFTRHLRFVYLGNVFSPIGSATHCHACRAELIQRSGYTTHVVGLKDGRCSACGADNKIVP